MKSNRAFLQKPGNGYFCSRAILASVTSECPVKMVIICKIWTGTLANRTQRLIRNYTICLNYGKLRVKWNNLKSPFTTISQPTLREIDPTVLSVLWLHLAMYWADKLSSQAIKLRLRETEFDELLIWLPLYVVKAAGWNLFEESVVVFLKNFHHRQISNI